MVTFVNFPVTIPVFVGNFSRFEDLTPQPNQSSPWKNTPSAGDTTECWIGYSLAQEDKLAGYAYPVCDDELKMVPETTGVYRLPDGTVIVPATGSTIGAWYDKKEGIYVFEIQAKE